MWPQRRTVLSDEAEPGLGGRVVVSEAPIIGIDARDRACGDNLARGSTERRAHRLGREGGQGRQRDWHGRVTTPGSEGVKDKAAAVWI